MSEHSRLRSQEATMSSKVLPSVDALVAELWVVVQPELERNQHDRAIELLRAMVEEWLVEAGGEPTMGHQIIAVLRADFHDALVGRSGDAILWFLHARILSRELGRLSVRSFALAKQRLGGEISPADARPAGQEILTAVERIRSAVATIPEPALTRPIQRRLEDVFLEGLYAVEGKAMSRRLARARCG